MLKISFTGTLPVVFFKGDDNVVAFCPALDLSTCGEDIREAQSKFAEVLKAYLDETFKHGTFEKDLMKLGWKPHPKNLTLVPPAKDHRSIPLHILKSINFPLPVTA